MRLKLAFYFQWLALSAALCVGPVASEQSQTDLEQKIAELQERRLALKAELAAVEAEIDELELQAARDSEAKGQLTLKTQIQAILFSQPSATSKRIGGVPKDVDVGVHAVDSPFFQVTFNGQRGYVLAYVFSQSDQDQAAEMLKPEESNRTIDSKPVGEPLRTVRITEKTRIFLEPGFSGPSETWVPVGSSVELYSFHDSTDTVQVGFEDRVGWVRANAVAAEDLASLLRDREEEREEKRRREREARITKEQREREARIAEHTRLYGAEAAKRIAKREIWLGMTSEMARLSLGNPRDINRTVTTGRISEQWVYGGDLYLYFDNGILTSWQD